MARKKHSLGCLFYVALILLVLVVFLFNRQNVQDVLEKTGFTKLFHRQPAEPVIVSPPESPATPQAPAPREQPSRPPAQETPPPPGQEAPQGPPEGREVVVTVRRQSAAERAPEEKPRQRSRQSRLYFLTVAGDGAIELKGVLRPVEYVDAPLTATLEALLAGPTSAEVNQGLISMLSPQVRLRRVWVKGDTAYLDFNEAFRFNSLGKEGLAAQLEQVVYSATEFPNVKRVQLLIDGKVTDYLGPEGISIGNPLSRESFRQ